jgi:hypothetical protein
MGRRLSGHTWSPDARRLDGCGRHPTSGGSACGNHTQPSGGGEGQDPDGSGSATLSLDAEAGIACFDLTCTKIRGPLAAHIHEGAVTESGDIVDHSFDMKGGTPIFKTIKGVDGCVRNVDASVIDAILADPAGYYGNVHNIPFPCGAIRGQLEAAWGLVRTSATSCGRFHGPPARPPLNASKQRLSINKCHCI